MKKIKLALFLILSIFSPLFSFTDYGQDVIVLMDYSKRMLPYIDEINSKILTPMCNLFLSENDSVHLILFTDHPTLEISQQIRQKKELDNLTYYFNLLYPISEKSDFLSGLQYANTYISTLDIYRHKKLLIISDGIITESLDIERKKTSLNYFIKKLLHEGVEISFFEFPEPEDANIISLDGKIMQLGKINEGMSKRKIKRLWKKRQITSFDNGCSTYIDYKPFLRKQKNIITTKAHEKDDIIKSTLGILDVTVKENQGLRSRDMILTVKIKNNGNCKKLFELTQILVDGENVLHENVFAKIGKRQNKIIKAKIKMNEGLNLGKQEVEAKLVFSNNYRTSPQTVKFSAVFMPGKNIPYTIGKIVQVVFMIILALLILAVIIYFAIIKPSEKTSVK